MSFEIFSPIWSHVNENEKKSLKNKIFKKLKKKCSGDMMDRYLSPKFGVNPLDGFRESDVYGWTKMTDDGCPRDDSSSAVQ